MKETAMPIKPLICLFDQKSMPGHQTVTGFVDLFTSIWWTIPVDMLVISIVDGCACVQMLSTWVELLIPPKK